MKKILLILLLTSPLMAARGPSDPLPGTFQFLPNNDVWRVPINTLSLSTNSATWVNMDADDTDGIHMGFGTTYGGSWNGLPYNIVCGGVTPLNTNITWNAGSYVTQSSTLPAAGLPLPQDAIMEGDTNSGTQQGGAGADNHIILVDTCTPVVWEIFQASRTAVWAGAGTNYSGAWTIMQLSSWSVTTPDVWPYGWTSANAAGVPELIGLVNYNEVQTALSGSGVIPHALLLTINFSGNNRNPLWPGRHYTTGAVNYPPLGLRARLKSSFDISGYSATNQVILQTLKTYGAIFTDNGGGGQPWTLGGAPNANWNDTDLANITSGVTPLANMEIVDESAWMITNNSGQVNLSTPTVGHLWSGSFTLISGGTYQ